MEREAVLALGPLDVPGDGLTPGQAGEKTLPHPRDHLDALHQTDDPVMLLGHVQEKPLQRSSSVSGRAGSGSAGFLLLEADDVGQQVLTLLPLPGEHHQGEEGV